MRGYLRGAHPDWSAAAIEATVGNMRVGADGSLSRRLPIPAHMQIVRSMWDDPPRPYYAAIDVPTLLIPAISKTNSTRAARSRSRVAEAAALLGHSTIREYGDSDHDLHAQHPDGLAADLLSLAAS